MTVPVVVVDQIFSCIEGADAQPRLQDFVLSMVFANAAARAQSKQGDGFAPDAFRGAWSSALGNLGWVITGAGTSTIHTQSRGATTTLADRIIASAPSAGVEKALSALNALCGDGSDKGDDAGLAKLWWQSGSDFAPFYASVGSVDLTGTSVVAELAQFSVKLDDLEVKERGFLHPKSKPLDPNSAAAIFDDVLESSIELSAFHIQLELHPEKFAASKQDLIAKLADKVFDHFITSPAGLYGEKS